MHPTDDLMARGLCMVARAASPKMEEPTMPLTADDVRAIVREEMAAAGRARDEAILLATIRAMNAEQSHADSETVEVEVRGGTGGPARMEGGLRGGGTGGGSGERMSVTFVDENGTRFRCTP